MTTQTYSIGDGSGLNATTVAQPNAAGAIPIAQARLSLPSELESHIWSERRELGQDLVLSAAERVGSPPPGVLALARRAQGWAEVTTSCKPTDTQSLAVGQEMPPLRWLDVCSLVAVHAAAPPVGSAETTMLVATS